MTASTIILGSDQKTVIVGDIVYPVDHRAFRALKCFAGKPLGEFVRLTIVDPQSPHGGVYLREFFSAHPEWGFRREVVANYGTRLNCVVEYEDKWATPVRASGVVPKGRRPVPLKSDDVLGIARRYASGEISREEMGRLFWRAPA